ncbi:MAG: hypothetical protein V8S32_10760 [Lachnospiraceae bacterium]
MIENGAGGVEVSPGALAASGVILLFRSVAALQYDCKVLLFIGAEFAGGSEVDQGQPLILAQNQVFRADIPVKDAAPVHGRERLHNGAYELQCLVLGKRFPVLLHIFAQRNSLHIIHNQVGGFILAQHFPEGYNRRDIRAELQQASFFAEAFQAGTEVQSFIFTGREYSVAFLIANGQFRWKKLLDSDEFPPLEDPWRYR